MLNEIRRFFGKDRNKDTSKNFDPFTIDFSKYAFAIIQKNNPSLSNEEIIDALEKGFKIQELIISYTFHTGKTVIADYQDVCKKMGLYLRSRTDLPEEQSTSSTKVESQDNFENSDTAMNPKKKKQKNPFAPPGKKGFIPPKHPYR